MNIVHRVQIERIAIAKCNLFFYYRHPKEISLYYFCDTKLFAKHEKTREFHLYCWNVCKVSEWCLADGFHWESRVSTQMMVRDYCILKCKTFSAASGGLLVALCAIFFAIQNIYVNSNPEYMLVCIYFQLTLYTSVNLERDGFSPTKAEACC